MNIMDKDIDVIKSIARCIATQFGKNTEVAVHDFRGDLSSTIIAIENGHVTGREIGGCPTNLWLEDLKNNVDQKERFGYVTYTADGKILQSSTVNFKDDNGKLVGSICINQDMTDLIQLEKILKKLPLTNLSEISDDKKEKHSLNVQELLEELITEGLTLIDTPINKMNKESKMKFIEFLDSKGFFLIQKSGKKICDILGISNFTLYNYLDKIRKV